MIRIFLCSYQGERYIREQVESILKQETEQDFQILCSDDGSTDGTLKILQELQEEAGEEKLRILPPHAPTGCAWKHFLWLFSEGYSEGADYIMLSDQDDVWKRDKLEKTYQEMKRLEQSVSKNGEKSVRIPLLVHCDSVVVDSHLRELAPSFVAFQKMSPERRHLPELLVQNNVVGGAMMVNAALSEKLRVVPEHAVMHDQWMALVAAAFGEIRFLPESLYYYRQHEGNVVGADRGSRVGEILKRLGLFQKDGATKEEMDAHSRKVYGDLFLQAGEFLRIYGEELSEENKRLLLAFLSIPGRSRIGKILVILKYGFTYNLFHRTVGELIFI